MTLALKAIGRAMSLWYREPFTYVLLNIAWLILQIPIVTGPAATAAMYATAYRALNGEEVSVRTAFQDARRLFVPALVWGALNLLIAAALVVNFSVYGQVEGLLWAVLRALWAGIGTGWFFANVFFWPFWLELEQPSLRLSLFNSLLFLIKRPVYSTTVILATLIVIAASVLLTLPLGAAMMGWVALIGTAAVAQELELARAGRVEAAEASVGFRE